jgi:hypothetical protein
MAMAFRGTASVILILLSTALSRTAQQACTQATSECNNGIWSSVKCKCDCFPTFCLDDVSGACVTSSASSSSSSIRCNSVADDGSSANTPMQGCQVGIDCPWWNDDLASFSESRCITGSQQIISSHGAVLGINYYYTSNEECCAAHHPNNMESCITHSRVVLLDARGGGSSIIAPQYINRNLAEDDGLSSVTIKFTVNGLPEVVDNELLEEEMLMTIRSVLIDLSTLEPDLKVTGVEESPSFVKESSTTADGRSISIYYDVTMINDSGEEDFGPVIIEGFRNMYPSISQDINDCTGMVYLCRGIFVNWCIDGGGGGDFGVCVATHPKTTVDFRLANLPLQLKNVDGLIQQVVESYEAVLVPVQDLDILTIELKRVVDLPSSNNTLTKEVFVEIVDQKFDINANETADDPALGLLIDEQIQSSKYEILRSIQLYSDNSTDLDLNWCVDGNGTYTVCAKPPPPPEPPKPYPFLLPRWAIITLTVVSVLLTCCICWCTFSIIEQRDESKNTRNMVSYLHTGQQYSKPKKKPIRSPPPPPPPMPLPVLPRRNSRPVSHARVQQRYYYDERPEVESVVSLANDTKYLEAMPSFIFQHDTEAPRLRAPDTKYLENMNSFVFDDGQGTPRLPIAADDIKYLENAADDIKYLENAPSFIFDTDEGQPRNRLAITNGEGSIRDSRSKPDP